MVWVKSQSDVHFVQLEDHNIFSIEKYLSHVMVKSDVITIKHYLFEIKSKILFHNKGTKNWLVCPYSLLFSFFS